MQQRDENPICDTDLSQYIANLEGAPEGKGSSRTKTPCGNGKKKRNDFPEKRKNPPSRRAHERRELRVKNLGSNKIRRGTSWKRLWKNFTAQYWEREKHL